MKQYLKILFNIDNVIVVIIIFIVIEHFTIYKNLDFLNPFINIAEELDITDVVFSKIRNDGRYKTDSNIVLVNLGDLNRRGIAKLINTINKYEPAVVCLDVFLKKRKTNEQDVPLRNALNNTKNLIMPSKLIYSSEHKSFISFETSNPFFIENATLAYANLIIDDFDYFDNEQERELARKWYAKTIRRVSTRLKVNGELSYNMDATIVRFYAPDKFEKLVQRKDSVELIDYKRNIDKYITFDIKDIFEDDSDKLSVIKDKIVMVGFMGPDLQTLVNEDLYFTPLNPQYIGKSFPDMYGVVVHANVVSMILDESYFYEFPENVNFALKIIILYIMMTGLSFLRFKFDLMYEPLSITLVFASLVAWFVFMLYLFNVHNLYFELTDLFFYILLAVPIFELYQDSFKPMTLKKVKQLKSLIRRSK